VIKCVIWDLDNTLLDGVYLESGDQPPPVSATFGPVLRDLAGRGILHAIASRNPPEAGVYADQATGHAFAAVVCGWGAKSAAIDAITAELGLTADEVAFVDDDALERAEVAFRLPDVLVLAPQDLPDAAGLPQFGAPASTEEARRRGDLYLQRRARLEEARAFGGSREDFLRHCGTRVTIAPAAAADLPRLHELSVRTHQFNSTGTAVTEAEFAALLRSAKHQVAAVRLADRFGDDGLVGACVIATDQGGWQVRLLMMSCRALGRGVIDALLAWICRAARAGGAAEIAVACMISQRNVPLRIALTSAGFRAVEELEARDATRTAVYRRPAGDALPELPDWVTVPA
jgi:methoxymalonate biosynthesis protein